MDWRCKLVGVSILLFVVPNQAQDCSGWLERLPNHQPEGDGIPAMAFDSIRDVSVINGKLPGVFAQTWEWAGDDWTLRSGETTGPFQGAEMAFDSLRGICVAFGGALNEISRDDTWEWNGSVWTERFPPAAPDARQDHAMAFDLTRNVTVLFGGQYCAGFECDTLYGDIWEYDGKTWTERQIPGPSPRHSMALAYDQARGVTVLYGGTTSEGRSDETWEYDGAAWTLQESSGPGERRGHAMAYDSDRGVVVLFGGVTPNNFRNDLWEWDGVAWKEIQADPGPSPRENAGLVYDSARKALVLFGGFKTPSRFSDTWEFVCAPPCPPDLDENLKLDLFDFLAFLNLFNAADPAADCDASGVLDLFDFLCFTNAFNAGC